MQVQPRLNSPSSSRVMAREARTVVVAHGSHTIRAGFGIHEPLRLPSIELSAQVGLRRSHVQALRSHSAKLASLNSSIADGDTPGLDASASNQQDPYLPPVRPSDYLVGHFLEDALAHPERHHADPIHAFWPMVGGKIKDWGGMQALWYHLLFFTLPVVRSTNQSVTLLSLPPQAIDRATSAQIHKIFFEEFNCPALCLVDSSLVSTFAVGQLGACVVDVGWSGSSISCVLDALPVLGSDRRCEVGLRECIAYLATQLGQDRRLVQSLLAIQGGETSMSTVSPSDKETQLLLLLAEELFNQGEVSLGEGEDGPQATSTKVDDEGNFDVLGALTSGREKEAIAAQEKKNRALIEEGKAPEKIQTAAEIAANADISAGRTGASGFISFQFRNTSLRIPKSPLENAVAPLTDPSVLDTVEGRFLALPLVPRLSDELSEEHAVPAQVDWSSTPSLPDVISSSIHSILEAERRAPLWELLVITGQPTRVLKGLTTYLVSSLSKFIASSSAANGNGTGGMMAAGGGGPDETGAGMAFNGQQVSNARALKTPDYFVEFKDRTDLAPFLGATIYAKLVFADSQAKGYTLKSAYIERGPTVAFQVLPSDK